MSDLYILDESGRPVREPDINKWGVFFEDRERRRVAADVLTINGEEVRVSTVFLGMDHAWGGESPVLWETMVFGGKFNEDQDRCSGNREQAEAMHARMLERVRA
jgi:hypothetical protein